MDFKGYAARRRNMTRQILKKNFYLYIKVFEVVAFCSVPSLVVPCSGRQVGIQKYIEMKHDDKHINRRINCFTTKQRHSNPTITLVNRIRMLSSVGVSKTLMNHNLSPKQIQNHIAEACHCT